MTYIMSCVWLDYMVKYFQCKNCVGSSLKTKKCVASFLVPGDRKSLYAICVQTFFIVSPLGSGGIKFPCKAQLKFSHYNFNVDFYIFTNHL